MNAGSGSARRTTGGDAAAAGDAQPGNGTGRPSPSESYSAFRRRAAEQATPLGRFRGRYDFELDEFQVRACRALQDGRGVLVAAPTGSGKTVVGEFAVELALARGRKAFYTTPIKALSNQKYTDLVRRYGPEKVGLLTGDNTINGEAPVVVMTTEVLRNMLYADSPTLAGLGYVVMDEVHYLADRFRGAVWEEVIIHLPDDVLVVSLSATVSNAEEFGAWLDTVRGDTEVVVSEHRPVPLWQHVMVGTRLYDLFADPGETAVDPQTRVNRELLQLAREHGHPYARGPRGRTRRRPPRSPRRTPSRAEAVLALDAAGLLPAITFIFSRAGCEAAVGQCVAAGVRLTTADERQEIDTVVRQRCADIPEEDRAVLGFWDWAEALDRGIAAHHAGLLPTFKEVVEELFSRGLVKAVFATETLALGINMPARSVVLEKLVKWNGETHADMTPGEYTQLTGRAGRRGIDVEGHAVVLWQHGLDPEAVAGLASTRTYPLHSSFRPTYNMAVNLVGRFGRAAAREILETSFAQFQADRAVVGLARQARRQEEALAGYAEAMTCHLGDFAEYAALRRAISDREADLSRAESSRRRAEALASVERLRRGDVIRLQTGRRPGWAVVVEPGQPGGTVDRARPTVLTADRRIHRLSSADVLAVMEPVTRVSVPKGFSPRDPRARRDLASTLRNALVDLADQRRPGRRGRSAASGDETLAELRRRMRSHPCHGCDRREEHARWAERWWRLTRETDALVRRIESRTNTIARTFDRVCDLLEERGYLDGDRVTAQGRRLGRIYAESDLLIAECLREGVWAGLDGAGLAACVSALVYSARREDAPAPRIPAGATAAALTETLRIWSALEDRERDHRLEVTPEPDPGLARAVHLWARGRRLEEVLEDGDLAAGDFVRWCKQVVDLLGQVQQAVGDDEGSAPLRRTSRDAVERVRRGIVAYSSVS
ncbi:MAG: DEAD/DEAH box helicase [Actinomycetales bacterium]|nr:DEAD/DEAH box helicase [Actinomycetales bacterium]